MGARGANAGFELIEQVGVVVVDGVDEAGDQDFGADVGLGEESADEVGGAVTFEVACRKSDGVEEGAVLFVAREKTLAEEAIEGRHDGGVGEAGIEAFDDLLDGGAAEDAEDGEDFALAATEDAKWRERGTVFFAGGSLGFGFVHAKRSEGESMIDGNARRRRACGGRRSTTSGSRRGNPVLLM